MASRHSPPSRLGELTMSQAFSLFESVLFHRPSGIGKLALQLQLKRRNHCTALLPRPCRRRSVEILFQRRKFSSSGSSSSSSPLLHPFQTAATMAHRTPTNNFPRSKLREAEPPARSSASSYPVRAVALSPEENESCISQEVNSLQGPTGDH